MMQIEVLGAIMIVCGMLIGHLMGDKGNWVTDFIVGLLTLLLVVHLLFQVYSVIF